jgi:hypothetical protein
VALGEQGKEGGNVAFRGNINLICRALSSQLCKYVSSNECDPISTNGQASQLSPFVGHQQYKNAWRYGMKRNKGGLGMMVIGATSPLGFGYTLALVPGFSH